MDLKKLVTNSYIDERGSLYELINSNACADGKIVFGQVYCISFAQKGIVRGNHYHKCQKEVFMIVAGKVRLVLKSTITNEIFEDILDASNKLRYTYLIQENVAHAMEALENNSILISLSTEIYNPLNEDKYPYKLIGT
jgi:dTDP-4-dehydrorhamnose 3,5-epimerase